MSLQELKSMKVGQHEFLVNRMLGYYPYFIIELKQRIKQKKSCNIVVTGEAGVGKSYNGIDICRTLSKRFDVDDIVFTYPEFLRTVLTRPRGIPLLFDEPSYAMSKRDWYKQINKALVKTVESFRFKGKPLIIPIINKALLDSDIRNYLIQYHVHVRDRGRATAYRLYTSQLKASKVYNYEICKLKYKLFDNNLCNKDSCLTCRKLNPRDKSKRCMIFRARYERKKITTQEERYKVALEEAEKKETSKLTLDELEAKAMLHLEKFYDPDNRSINVNKLFVVLQRECGISLGHVKLYRLKGLIEYDNPKLFDVDPKYKTAKKLTLQNT